MKKPPIEYSGVEIEKSREDIPNGSRITLRFKLSPGYSSSNKFVHFNDFGTLFAKLVMHVGDGPNLGAVVATINHRKKQIIFNAFSPVGKLSDEQLLKDAGAALHSDILEELGEYNHEYTIMHKTSAQSVHDSHLAAIRIKPNRSYSVYDYLHNAYAARHRIVIKYRRRKN